MPRAAKPAIRAFGRHLAFGSTQAFQARLARHGGRTALQHNVARSLGGGLLSPRMAKRTLRAGGWKSKRRDSHGRFA